MRDLKDYSGQFVPDIKLSNFSQGALLRLASLYSRLYIALDGFWYIGVMERMGNEEALACDLRAWERGIGYEMRKMTEMLNIRGNDVAALMKYFQVAPWFQQMKYEIELANAKAGTITFTYCPTLEALEKEGKGRHAQICSIVEPEQFRQCASFFNPEMRVKCLTPLPREKNEDVPCIWRFWLD